MPRVEIDVSYRQIAVFDARIDDPFNDWTQDHTDQGFAWRPGSVSFGTIEGAGSLLVSVYVSRVFDELSSLGSRVIMVPFSVPDHEEVEIASIASAATVRLSPGERELIFEHGIRNGEMWASFYFRPVASPVIPRIIRCDPELSPPKTLLMTARPA